MSSFRKALKSQQKNHHERSQVIVPVLHLLFTITLPYKIVYLSTFYAYVFVPAGFQEEFGFVGEEEGLQTSCRVR